jgi:type IV secretion system protein TrbL
LRPGKVAQTGLDAGRPLLDSISNLMGYWSFFENFIQIACMFLAWALVLLAFFILAIQLFVTLIEFKLTTLAGFVLIPFGLFGKSAFMAERVLGNVISSGIKVLVLAVIIGIGSTLFSEFTSGFGGQNPSIDDAMAIVLAALSLLGLGIFGPGIAKRHRLGWPATQRRRRQSALALPPAAWSRPALAPSAPSRPVVLRLPVAPPPPPVAGLHSQAARPPLTALARPGSPARPVSPLVSAGSRAGGSAAVSPLRAPLACRRKHEAQSFNAGGKAARRQAALPPWARSAATRPVMAPLPPVIRRRRSAGLGAADAPLPAR